jgi:hypothetical protein
MVPRSPSSNNMKLTPQESEERRNLVLNLMREGLSRTEIQAQICANYDVSIAGARKIYIKVINELIVHDPIEQQRAKGTVLEMLYTQMTRLNGDINSLQTWIDEKEIDTNQMVNITQVKIKARGQIRICLSDIARINGLYTDMPIVQAINVLSTHSLIPPLIAADLLRAVEGVNETVLNAMQGKTKKQSSTEKDFD